MSLSIFQFLCLGFFACVVTNPIFAVDPNPDFIPPQTASASISAVARVINPLGISSFPESSGQINAAKNNHEKSRLLHTPSRDGLFVQIENSQGQIRQYYINNTNISKGDVIEPGLSDKTITLNLDSMNVQAESGKPGYIITIINFGI